MTGLLVVLIPLLLLFFLFAMQRIESSLLSTPGVDSSGDVTSTSSDDAADADAGENSPEDGPQSQPRAA